MLKVSGISILGVRIVAATKENYFQIIKNTVYSNKKIIIPSVNLHGLYIWLCNEKFRFINSIGIPHIDGTPIYWIANMFCRLFKYEHRVSIYHLLQYSLPKIEAEGLPIYILGYDLRQVNKIERYLKINYPLLKFKIHSGFFKIDDNEVNNEIINEIEKSNSRILLVGMGMGRQENWIADHHEKISANVIITIGAVFELFIGDLPIPPVFMSRCGLEWLFRFKTSPYRVSKRYLIEPFFVLFGFLRLAYCRLKNRQMVFEEFYVSVSNRSLKD